MATGIPILPVTIKDSIKILPVDSLDVSPGTATVTIHPPINIKNKSLEDLDQIISLTKNTIASAL